MTTGIPLPTLLVCLPPALFWLAYVYRESRHRPPPRGTVAVACLAGALSTAGVFFVDALLARGLPEARTWSTSEDFTTRLAGFVLVVGLLEEACKLASVRSTVYHARSFDEAVHGVVYSSAAALGFATVENAHYVHAHGPTVLLGRSVLSTFGHVLMSMVWGIAMGLQRTRPGPAWRGWALLATSLLLSALIHGIYDLLLVGGPVWAALCLLLALWRTFEGTLAELRRASPHRAAEIERTVACPACGAPSRGHARFCGACGSPVPPEDGAGALGPAPDPPDRA